MKDARLDVFLAQQHPQYSRSRIKTLIDEGFVLVDGQKRKPSFTLKGGEQIVLTRRAPDIPKAKPENIPLQILHEDGDLMVINKAVGMVVHPAPGHYEGTLVSAVMHHLSGGHSVLPPEPPNGARSDGVNPILACGNFRPGIVHRLDKGTSGVMVIAKNDETLGALMNQFKNRTVIKHYRALVFGTLRGKSGTIRKAIGRDNVHRRKFSSKSRNPREAVTHYEVVEVMGGVSLLTLRLETGRTHQIRVHLSEEKHPIVGDTVYGARSYLSSIRSDRLREGLLLVSRPLLHSWRLSFKHPRTSVALNFEAPLPDDFESALNLLRFGEKAS